MKVDLMTSSNVDTIPGEIAGIMSKKNPYYIVAPPYIRTSAGVRVLYRLCDLINKSGHSAFIYQRPHWVYDLSSSPSDVAPFLNKKIIDYHFDAGLTPIVIYPETIRIEKFSAPFRVRYVLNYDNFLSESIPLTCDDYLLAYSENIAKELGFEVPLSIINLPVSNPDFFTPPESEKRRGAVFYAGKYKYHFAGKTLPITDDMVEITRDKPDSQTPDEIKELFQSSEFFYCYEDSSLIIEAMLCGCPVVLVPNEYYKETLIEKELNGLGYAWGNTPQQLKHAKETVCLVRPLYFRLLEDSNKSVRQFIKISQRLVRKTPYNEPFANGYIKKPSFLKKFFGLFVLIKQVSQDKGIKQTFVIALKRLRALRIKIY